MPSEWYETFGLSAAESLLYGKPVIATNIGPLSYLVKHNVNGLLFDYRNHLQLAEAIKRLRDNPAFAVRMGKNGRKFIEELCNERDHYERIIKVYNEARGEIWGMGE